MVFLFLYLDVLRMRQFLRLRRDDRADMAIEVAMPRQRCRSFAVRWNDRRYRPGPMNLYGLGPIQCVGGAGHRELVQTI